VLVLDDQDGCGHRAMLHRGAWRVRVKPIGTAARDGRARSRGTPVVR
jgi:hypothetical protein